MNAATDQPCEAYRYTTFGEEALINAQGEVIPTSVVGNPLRFASKRIDLETGWVYFSRRFYDPINTYESPLKTKLDKNYMTCL